MSGNKCNYVLRIIGISLSVITLLGVAAGGYAKNQSRVAVVEEKIVAVEDKVDRIDDKTDEIYTYLLDRKYEAKK